MDAFIAGESPPSYLSVLSHMQTESELDTDPKSNAEVDTHCVIVKQQQPLKEAIHRSSAETLGFQPTTCQRNLTPIRPRRTLSAVTYSVVLPAVV
jgi:hypothetical protein